MRNHAAQLAIIKQLSWQELHSTAGNCQADDRQESCSSAGNCQADEQTLITQLSRPGSGDWACTVHVADHYYDHVHLLSVQAPFCLSWLNGFLLVATRGPNKTLTIIHTKGHISLSVWCLLRLSLIDFWVSEIPLQKRLWVTEVCTNDALSLSVSHISLPRL